MVNWLSRDRRLAVQLTCLSTADNLTGFVFRSDLNFDPSVGDIVEDFEGLLAAKEFDDPEQLGLFARYDSKAYLGAVQYLLKRRLKADKNDQRAQELLAEVEKIGPLRKRDQEEDLLPSDNPISGLVIRKSYTALAHYVLIDELFREDADIHHSTDTDGALAGMLLAAMSRRVLGRNFDAAVVAFEKELSNPKKRARVKVFKERFREFAAGAEHDGITGVTNIRRAFIKAFRTPAPAKIGIPGRFWEVPIQTMYEPDKMVGIVHQRPGLDAEDDELLSLALLDRSSLHSADSFFAVLRKRISYFDRGGMSRATGTHYHAFQPYRPAMVQKMVDIARVYFNWCEPRPFRLVRHFKTLAEEIADSSHEHIDATVKGDYRRALREEFTTPAMRLGLARKPTRLDTILYNDWRVDALPPADLSLKAA
jgi:hypothetical protein